MLKHLGARIRGVVVDRVDALRESYWFVPMVMSVAAAGLALTLIEVDDRLDSEWSRRLPWIQDAGAEGTRALLSTVAGSMITVTGVVFSISIVALTLASSQFGPRLLRNFLRDRGNQIVLGTFVATFLYSLLVLRAVEADRVPHIATAVGLGLAVACVFVLIYFVHHAASSIQASSVIASVALEIDHELPNLFPETLGSPSEDDDTIAAALPDADDVLEIESHTSGYLRVVGGEALIERARACGVVVELLVRPGEFVGESDRLARVSPGHRCEPEDRDALREAFVFGSHRTAVQDLEFLTDQLAEMAVRALSPGVNDPKTALACIDRLGIVIRRVSLRRMPSPIREDEDGDVRILTRPTTFPGIVASALDPIRRYGANDPEVVERVLDHLARTLDRCRAPSRREALRTHAEEWVDAAARHRDATSARDRARIDAAAERVRSAAEVRC